MPQGWGFFTKPPSDETVVALAINGETENAMKTPQVQLSNLYGLSRKQRAQGPEIANITNRISENHWIECEDGQHAEECVSAQGTYPIQEKIENNSPVPTLCGLVTFGIVNPVPWSYRDFYDGLHLTNRIVTVDVQC